MSFYEDSRRKWPNAIPPRAHGGAGGKPNLMPAPTHAKYSVAPPPADVTPDQPQASAVGCDTMILQYCQYRCKYRRTTAKTLLLLCIATNSILERKGQERHHLDKQHADYRLSEPAGFWSVNQQSGFSHKSGCKAGEDTRKEKEPEVARVTPRHAMPCHAKQANCKAKADTRKPSNLPFSTFSCSPYYTASMLQVLVKITYVCTYVRSVRNGDKTEGRR